MLDHTRLIQELGSVTDRIFLSNENQAELAFQKWLEISKDACFSDLVSSAKSSFLLPEWQGCLGDIIKVNSDVFDYSVLAVDGSQIYPERWISGINCTLLNTGQCLLEYGKKSRAHLYSVPKILTLDELTPGHQNDFSPEIVDFRREELELNVALNEALRLSESYKKDQRPFFVFFDGSLIFWQLESKFPEIKKYFLDAYLGVLDSFYQNNLLIAGYISMPRSRELVNLTKIGFCNFDKADCIGCHSAHEEFPCNAVDQVLDVDICCRFLDKFERTIVFKSRSKITEYYPAHLKPCFVYLNVGSEIIRLEFPFWMAQTDGLLDLVCKTAVDQAIKGNGYPVVLAEAHEQAVIRGHDRDFFYNIVQKKGILFNQKMTVSQKNIKKYTHSHF